VPAAIPRWVEGTCRADIPDRRKLHSSESDPAAAEILKDLIHLRRYGRVDVIVDPDQFREPTVATGVLSAAASVFLLPTQSAAPCLIDWRRAATVA
jgi:hypothetical protein